MDHRRARSEQAAGLRDHWKCQARLIERDTLFKGALVAKENSDHAAVKASWGRLVTEWLGDEADYIALRWCIFDHHFPEDYRRTQDLPLPRPGKLGNRRVNPLWEARPELDALPRRLQERVRALPASGKAAVLHALIIDICTEVPLDEAGLAVLLRREVGTIRSYLADLTKQGAPRLSRDPATGKHHPKP